MTPQNLESRIFDAAAAAFATAAPTEADAVDLLMTPYRDCAGESTLAA